MNDKLFYISVTGIIVNDNKFLIVKRSDQEKVFPGKWTVPGGKFQHSDYHSTKPNSAGVWYATVERALLREVKEEVDLETKDIDYVTSMCYVRPDGFHCTILSFSCIFESGEVKLCSALTDFRWVTLEEAKSYDLIDGIYDELVIVAGKRKII
jgi:8-oxo-dGTP pyrophosphatase MutT (NUDIX family)